jgi:hypothetical protein
MKFTCERTSVVAAAMVSAALFATPAIAQQASNPDAAAATAAQDQPPPADTSEQARPDSSTPSQSSSSGSGTDIFSRDTFAVLLDGRIVVANGERSFLHGGFGKTRFDGTSDGDYDVLAIPAEGTLAWMPRFTNSLSANISASWQRGQEHNVDLIEAFINFLPPQHGAVGVSARAGLMWPEISLEHATGGAWSTVYTITPSAINSWVGEEVKVVGLEGTLHAALGQHQLAATAAVFGFDDTSGTLLSFRGWALHDVKATAFGHFPLPPRNPFMESAQEGQTRSLLEIDHRPGFYGRVEWRPPWPVGASIFYYDNRGKPEAFTPNLQWGWRTRFWNLGINADLGPNTRLLAQGMTGSTIMGFPVNGVPWVHTRFKSAYALVSQQLDEKTAITGRVEAFSTRERGSEMSPDESEHGWSWTAAVRRSLTDNLTLFIEALNVRSHRGTRTRVGLDPFQAQTVFQAALRFTL